MVGVQKVLLQDISRDDERLRALEKDRPENPDRQQELLEAREAVPTQVERLRCFDYKNYITRAHSERDKLGALLAWLANPARRGSVILELRDQHGVPRYDQQGIKDLFLTYYTELYMSLLSPH